MANLYNKYHMTNSRNLRKNMTKEERHLWYDFLKDLPITIKRQKVFANYIVDFYCDKGKFIIEIDGSQHYDEISLKKDKIRDEYFENLGIKVLRYTNYDVSNRFGDVCNDIMQYVLPLISQLR